MLIALCSLFSFTSYNIFNYNKTLKKEISPFLFLGILFSLFFIEFTGLYGLGISYTTFFILDIFLLTITCIFFYIFFFKTIYDNRFNKLYLKNIAINSLENLTYLFIMIFFTCFLLFFHSKSEYIYWDNIYYQGLATHYMDNKTNSISSFINNSFSSLNYSIVGYYSFLASLGTKQILINYPYFNMFLYFYFILTCIYYINIKYIKNSWTNILLFLSIFAFVFIIYFYCSKFFGYLLYGNYSSSFFFGLLIIPSIFTTKNKQFHYKYIIPLIWVSMLFYNETSILCGIVYFITYFIFLLFIKRKINGVFITLPTILCTMMNIYFFICYYVSGKKDITQLDLMVFKLLPLVIYLIIILWIIVSFLDLINYLEFKFFKKFLQTYKKINNILTLPQINKLNNDWFNPWKINTINNIYKIIVGLIITGLLAFFMWFGDWNDFYNYETLTKNWMIIGTIIFIILFYISFLFLYKNPFFNFYVLSVFVSFGILFISKFIDPTAFDTFILYRWIFGTITMIPYLNPTTVYLYVATILYTFIIIIINKQIYKYNLFFINKNNQLYKKSKFTKVLALTSIMSVATLSSILVPTLTYNENTLLSFSNIETNFYGGVSIKTINQLKNFNFNNQLTFAIIPLPIINTTSKFNINYKYFMTYWNTSSYLNNIEAKYIASPPAFVNIKTKKYFYNITNQNWEEDILPYYKYIVIRSFNKMFLNFINEINQNKITDFKLIKNINNQIYIFDNKKYNQELSNIFYYYNHHTFL